MINIRGTKFADLFQVLAYDFIRCDPEPVELLDDALNIPTIYFLTNMAGVIQYIGQTKQLALRIAQHKVNTKLNRRIDWRRTFYTAPGIAEKSRRLRFEATLITLCNPPGNQVILMRKCKNNLWSEVRWRGSRRKKYKRLKYTKKKKG